MTMSAPRAATREAPAREVLVARQPVLDGDMGLLGFELLVDGAGVIVDALSEVGLDTLTGGHAAWLPLPRELLLEVAALPMRTDRVVLEVAAGDAPDEELAEALRHLARRGVCIALDRVTHGPAVEALLEPAWGVKLDLAEHGPEGLRAQVEALAGRDLS